MNRSSEKWKRGMVIFLRDLHLLASLYVAQFIVWRTIRARHQERLAKHQERLARLKSLKLISGGGQAMGGSQTLTPNGMDEKRVLREAVRDSGIRLLRVATPSNVSGE